MGTRCPKCNADNAWWGTDDFVVCPFCGTVYYPNASSPSALEQLKREFEEEQRTSIERNGGKPLTKTSAESFRKGIERMLASKIARFYIQDKGFPEEELAKIASMLPEGTKIEKVKDNLSKATDGVVWYGGRDRFNHSADHLLVILPGQGEEVEK